MPDDPVLRVDLRTVNALVPLLLETLLRFLTVLFVNFLAVGVGAETGAGGGGGGGGGGGRYDGPEHIILLFLWV